MAARIRVLSVQRLFRPLFSGEGEWWLRMVPHLRARGVDVAVLASRCDGGVDLPTQEVVEGLRVDRVGRPGTRRPYLSFLGGAARFLVRHRGAFDVALFHGAQADAQLASVLLGRLCGWKTVFKMTLYPANTPLAIRHGGRLGRLRFRLLRLADGFISISNPLAQAYRDAGFPPAKLLVTTQAVESERFAFDEARRRRAREELAVPPGTRVVLFVGTIHFLKGVDILVEAWRRVVENVPDVCLVLVGPEADDAVEPGGAAFARRIADAVRAPEFRGTVRLAGYTREVERYYAAAHLFVLPSRWEGMPNVVLEAMASGLPCIVSELDGVTADIFGEACAGVIVKSQDPEAYAVHIRRLLEERTLAADMGREARVRVAHAFDMDRVADEYVAFLQRVVKPGARARALRPEPPPAGPDPSVITVA